jgi:hypothetical protein
LATERKRTPQTSQLLKERPRSSAPDAADERLAAAPDPEHQADRHGDEAGAEAPPEAGEARARAEREPAAEREREHPVADEVEGGRRARPTHRAQHTRGDRLRAVEDLERARDREDRRRGGDDRALRRVEPRQLLARDHEAYRRERHEAAAARDAEPRRAPRLRERARSDQIADAHRRPLRDPERHHERDRGEVHHEAVRGHRLGAEPAGDQRRPAERPHFERHLERDREAEHEQRAQARAVERAARPRHPRALVEPEADHQPHAGAEHQDARQARREPRADEPERRRAEVPEHEHPVAECVHHVPEQHHPEHRPNDLATLEILAQRRVAEEERHARDLHEQEALRLVRELRILPEEDERLRGQRPCPDHAGAHREREHDALLEGQPRPLARACAVRLAHDRVEPHQDAVREEQRAELPRIRDRHRGERLDGDAPDHDQVHEAHPHDRELRERHGDCERREAAGLLTERRQDRARRRHGA